MRYYIEAFDAEGVQILGNLDGQRALGQMSVPTRSKAWRSVVTGALPASPRVARWDLVNDRGDVVARCARTLQSH